MHNPTWRIVGLSSQLAPSARQGMLPTLGLACALGLTGCLWAAAATADPMADSYPGDAWAEAAPGGVGWSEDGLAEARAWSGHIGSSAVMVIQHGAVVAQWGDVAARMKLRSVRKSLLSALVGIAAARGQLSPGDTLGKLGINDTAPSLSEAELGASVADLLGSRSGVYHPALYEALDAAANRPSRGSHAPGTYWYYNNWDFNALGAILEHATGSSIFDGFAREIAGPVGMQDYRASDGYYVVGAASVYPAYEARVSARDLARFAYLYLHSGRWGTRQVVPAEWVRDTTQAQSDSGFGPGYGGLWWTGPLDSPFGPVVRLPTGTFFASGLQAQFAFVLPAYDMVIVHRIDSDSSRADPDLRQIGRLLWLILRASGVKDIGPDTTLAAAPGERLSTEALQENLAGATLTTVSTASGGPHRLQFGADGVVLYQRGPEAAEYDRGRWEAVDGKLCRTSDAESRKRRPSRWCYTAMLDGKQLRLFDREGLMQSDTLLAGSPAPTDEANH